MINSVENVTLPSTLRTCILKGEITEPIVFKQIHKSWLPLTSLSLDHWGRLLSESQQLSVRCGRKETKGHSLQRVQWESDCRHVKVDWQTLSRWDLEEKSIPKFNINSTNHWLYYDYKYMSKLLEPSELQKFEWSKLGFPDRHGKDSTLWIGTTDSYTPCHFDTYGCNLVTQIIGKKKWILFPPEDSKFMRPTRIPYEESSVYSKINVVSPKLDDLKELIQCHPIHVTLEPGDVLFVPSRWWHFVKSETFTISVNTWIELAGDVNARLEEAIIRSLMSFVCNAVSPDTVSEILNPNEADVLELSEDDVLRLLASSSQAVTATESPQSGLSSSEQSNPRNSRLHMNDDHRNPPPKKRKQDSPTRKEEQTTTKLDQLLKSFPCMRKLDALNFEITRDDPSLPQQPSTKAEDNCEDSRHDSSNSRSHLEHLFNAIGHPDILKQISAQFLRNVSQ